MCASAQVLLDPLCAKRRRKNGPTTFWPQNYLTTPIEAIPLPALACCCPRTLNKYFVFNSATPPLLCLFGQVIRVLSALLFLTRVFNASSSGTRRRRCCSLRLAKQRGGEKRTHRRCVHPRAAAAGYATASCVGDRVSGARLYSCSRSLSHTLYRRGGKRSKLAPSRRTQRRVASRFYFADAVKLVLFFAHALLRSWWNRSSWRRSRRSSPGRPPLCKE